jgi:multiple sugar transport system substrate-binding protein
LRLPLHILLRRAVLAGAFGAAIALVLFVRAPGNSGDPRVPVQLWQVTGAEEVEPVVLNRFNERSETIRVQQVGLPFFEIEQKFLTAVVGNIPPDVFEYFGSVAQWSTRGALMPLDDLMERDGFDRNSVFPALWSEMMWDGRTFAIPTGVSNEAFYWNKQHFREAGLDPELPPQTWDDLTTYALKLTKYAPDRSIERAGYIPGYWGANPTSLFLNWPVQKGARFLSEDGRRVTLNTKAGVESLEWERQLFEKLGRDALIRKRATFGYGTQHGFIAGQLSMIVQKSSFIQELQKFGPDLDYGCTYLPIPSDGKRGVIAGSVWVGIPAGAKHPEEAWEFIKYYTRADTQTFSAEYLISQKVVAFFPSNIEAANSPMVRGMPHMDVFVKSMDWAQSSTVVPLAHTVFWRSYQDAWDRVMRGAAEPERSLAAAEYETQKALNDQLEYIDFYREHLKKEQRTDTKSIAQAARR